MTVTETGSLAGHGLAAQSGGRLVLRSEVGQGTSAEIWLPVAAEVPAALELVKPVLIETVPPIRSLSVLVVDDDVLVLQNTSAMLEDLGHTVVEAASAKEALACLDRVNLPDVVITDQAMPAMTGLQLADTIKVQWPHLPIILATGYADLPSALDPAILRLAKPFRQYELAQAIEASLGAETESNVVPFAPKHG